ncbi:MAG TPA: Lpg1974 family pore-forming outer membrane protein [Rhabdochlamydiaceae bacterium]|nr:Lpg1974 family pore-forming outer membrane protein [Rhabdochlamydiaceae bacterium]
MKTLCALSLLTAASLIADNSSELFLDDEEFLAENAKKSTQNQNNSQQPRTSYSDSSCCKPCCVPKPKKCINCECYTPAFYESNGCDNGLFITADFLYWYGKETNLAYASKEMTVPQSIGSTGSIIVQEKTKHLGAKWAPGFRVGIGMETDCDGWDYYLNYTWYHSKKTDETSVASNFGTSASPFNPLVGQEALLSPWININIANGSTATFFTPYLFNRISAEWKLTLNDLVFELGRKFWLSKCFVMRPYAALRGAWVRRDFEVMSIRDNTPAAGALARFKSDFLDRFWGVGMELGLQPEWYFSERFAVISNFDAALLWGRFRNRKKEDDVTQAITMPVDYHRTSSNIFSKMQAIFDLMVGFRWDETWACNRYRTALDIGWEQHFWLNFSNMIRQSNTFLVSGVFGAGTFQSGSQSFTENQGDLIFGGLTVRFRFDF